jgi:hypothetical protein
MPTLPELMPTEVPDETFGGVTYQYLHMPSEE